MTDDLLTLSEMAERLKLSTKTFRNDVRARSIPFVPAGKRMRFDPYVVLAYLETTEQPIESNVVKLPVIKKGKVKIVSSRFAEA